MLRNAARLAVVLNHWHSRLHRRPAFQGQSLVLLQLPPILTRDLKALSSTAAHQDINKDFALPNASWKKDLIDLYEKFMGMTKSGTWKKLPSYSRSSFNLSEPEPISQRRTRFFPRNLDVEGAGLEYVMFLNPEEKRIVGLFQMGPYLEGPPGFTHGGCIATIIDVVAGTCALRAAGKIMTANLNVNFRNPVSLGSVVVVESHVDKIEGRKVFVSCLVRSADDTILHAEATALFIKFNEVQK